MTILRREKFGLPLLQRELTELSARPRTFVTRSLYAVVFFGLIGWQFGEQFSQTDIDALRDLGRGRRVFDHLMMWQLVGVCLFMPILSSGAVAFEKERGTLQLLMITQLSPWLILVEKLASRVFVMVTLLLPAVPVTAYAYSLGGIEPLQIAGSFAVLFSTACYIGAFSLICSSYCSNATSSLISTFIFGLPFLGLSAGFVIPAISSDGGPGMWASTVVTQTFFVLMFLQLAQTALVMRAGQPPRNLGLEFLRWTDRFWNGLNEKYTGGVIVVSEQATLPEDEPIAWRESHKKSLGSFRYLLRVLLAVEIPTLFIIALNLDFLSSEDPVPSGLLWMVWIIAGLLISARVSSVISGERGRQTLEVLLTTPLTGRDIVRQHYHGILKLLLVLGLPILTCYPLRWIYSEAVESQPDSQLVYICSSLAAIVVYLPLCAWISMLVGLRIRSPIKAMLMSIVGLALWIVGPLFLVGTPIASYATACLFLALPIGFTLAALLVWTKRRAGTGTAVQAGVFAIFSLVGVYLVLAWIFTDVEWGLTWIRDIQFSQDFSQDGPGFNVLTGPAVLIVWQERAMVPPGTVVLNFAWYGFLLFAVRGLCLRRADAWLGRAEAAAHGIAGASGAQA
ncbi:MAG: ABC transporter permease [Planctomycetota bacterium]|nr:ABC transporter permease [Planctomycetota bacterium]MDA1247759.1 ABC transporter permease [Planctomycetota bacterium]